MIYLYKHCAVRLETTSRFSAAPIHSFTYETILEKLKKPVPTEPDILRIRATTELKRLIRKHFQELDSTALVSSTDFHKEILTLQTSGSKTFDILITYTSTVISIHLESNQEHTRIKQTLDTALRELRDTP